MNPRINALADDVGTLAALRAERKRIETLEAAVIERLRAVVTLENMDDFRAQYGSVLVPARVAPKVDAMPLASYADVCRTLDVWPLRADVSPCASKEMAQVLVARTWGGRWVPPEIRVPLTPLLEVLRHDGKLATDLIAVPPPSVADVLRERGELPAATYWIVFRAKSMDAPTTGDPE